MTAKAAVVRYCGANRTRTAGTCGKPAGWGTDHVGFGQCRYHGGTTPNGRKFANRQKALTFARGALGAEVGGTPLDALEQSVRLAAGIVDYYRHEIADATVDAASSDEADREAARRRIGELVGPYTEAVKLQKDVAKAATDAGVAERRQVLAERAAALLGAAFEDALAEVASDLLDAAARAAIVRVFAQRLAVLETLEPEPLALPSGER